MVDILATVSGAVRPSANDAELEVGTRVHRTQPRQQRIAQLREAIEAGEYRVSAADLADALLRIVRQAN